MKTQRTPAQRRRTVTWSMIGLLVLALLMLSLILAGVDCSISGGVLVRTPSNSYTCVATIK